MSEASTRLEIAMESPFVWFDLRTRDADTSRTFYEQMFGWSVAEMQVGEATVKMIGGERPWASVVTDEGEHLGWFPYVQVEDLESATQKAKELGAIVLQAPAKGPAGTLTPIREPGGAVFALFHPGS
jgi:predicted enzyme related to lactoylglutathione lyase